MFWVTIKRIFRGGFVSFWRNPFVSLASVLMLSITLFVIGSLVFNNALLDSALAELKNKVDVNVYFVTEAPEEDILALKKNLEAIPEVLRVTYVSREEALADFKARHENDSRTLQALEELGDNPLGAVLNIKTKEPSQYASIAAYLKDQPTLSASGLPIIDKVNYYQNKTAIDRLTSIIDSSERSNLAKTLGLAIVSVIVTFNTIRLAIYTAREEISVMQLVGASRTYVRGPFVVAGVISGMVAGLVTIISFYPLTYWFGPLFYPFPIFLGDNIGKLSLFNYYLDNLGEIFLIIMLSGIILGGLSSYLAVRRYLKV
jgi:cell division transport system permease protein